MVGPRVFWQAGAGTGTASQRSKHQDPQTLACSLEVLPRRSWVVLIAPLVGVRTDVQQVA